MTFISRLKHPLRRTPKVPNASPQALGFYSIYLASFLFTFSYALPMYLFSSYISRYVSEASLGLLFALGSLIALFLLFEIPPILRKYGNRNTALVCMAVEFLSLIGLAIFRSPLFVFPLFLVNQAMLSVIVFNLDLFLESFSKDSSTGAIRGAYLSLINLAILIAPFTAGLIFVHNEFWRIFIFSALVITGAMMLVFFSLRTFEDPLYIDISFVKAFEHLKDERNIRNALLTRFLLNFFYAWFTIYVPIYLHTIIGFSLGQIIGIIFPLALIPFLLIEFPLGHLADRRHDEKILLMFGFFILGTTTILFSFLTSHNIFFWAGLIACGRFGAAMVEVMSGTYFFKHADASNSNLISMFRSLLPVATILAPIIASVLLLFFDVSLQYIFIVLGIIVLFGIPISFALERPKRSLLV